MACISHRNQEQHLVMTTVTILYCEYSTAAVLPEVIGIESGKRDKVLTTENNTTLQFQANYPLAGGAAVKRGLRQSAC